MEDQLDVPGWFLTSDGEYQDYETITLEEFCGRFDLTREKALWEIKRCKLWGCGKSVLFTVGVYKSSDPPYIIPVPECEKYAAIREAEHPPTAATPEPATTTPAAKPPKPTKKMTAEEFEKYTADYAEQRRKEGADDFDIAWELHRDEGASFERIGEIFHPNPPVAKNSYGSRGKRFLALK